MACIEEVEATTVPAAASAEETRAEPRVMAVVEEAQGHEEQVAEAQVEQTQAEASDAQRAPEPSMPDVQKEARGEGTRGEEPLAEPEEHAAADANEEQAEPSAPEQKQGEPGPPKAMAVDVEELQVQVEPQNMEGRKKQRSGPKTKQVSLEAITAKIKRLQGETEEAEAALSAEINNLEEAEAKVVAIRSAIDARRAEVAARRVAADRVSQDYVREQCKAAIAQLESDVPKRPPNIFMMFVVEHMEPGVSGFKQNQRIKEMWATLSDEGKKKYRDRYEAETRRFVEWGRSEEGQKNLRERNELLAKCKATAKEELGGALAATEPANMSPAKRAKAAEKAQGCTETPAKQRRVAPARAPTGPLLDEKVLEEAGKADLLAQLQNLAGRPDVMALGKSSQEVWDALKANAGIVNAAKRCLLGTS